jgi:hypothetical protein
MREIIQLVKTGAWDLVGSEDTTPDVDVSAAKCQMGTSRRKTTEWRVRISMSDGRTTVLDALLSPGNVADLSKALDAAQAEVEARNGQGQG